MRCNRLHSSAFVCPCCVLRLHVKCIHSFVVAQADLVKIQENTRKNLEVEIQGYKAEAQKQRQVCARAAAVASARRGCVTRALLQVIYGLEKEREKYGQQASDATAKYAPPPLTLPPIV